MVALSGDITFQQENPSVHPNWDTRFASFSRYSSPWRPGVERMSLRVAGMDAGRKLAFGQTNRVSAVYNGVLNYTTYQGHTDKR